MSSLLYTEEAGAAALVSDSTQGRGGDTGQFRWNLARRDAVRRMYYANAGPLLFECSSTFQLFPESGQQKVLGSNSIPIHDRAAHAVSFLRRYHPGIHVPSQVLSSVMLDDEQTQIRNEDDGSDLVQSTMALLESPSTSSKLLVCVGGVHRCELFVSKLETPCIVHASGKAIFETQSPIVQVVGLSGFRVMFRTRAKTWVGHLRESKRIATEGPRYKFVEQMCISASKALHADASWIDSKSVCMTDTRGTTRIWDVARQRCDKFWTSNTSQNVVRVASCYTLYSHDMRTPRPNIITQTSHSGQTLCRAKITSLLDSRIQVKLHTPLLALSTTEAVQYYDQRFPKIPVFHWSHRRGYDRTLNLCSVPGEQPEICVLSSRHNRLLITYGAGTDTITSANIVQPYVPRAISSAAESQWNPESPTPPIFAQITTASDTPDVLGCFEQTMLGAVWMRPMCRTELHDWPLVQPEWDASAYRKAYRACANEDPGPFGDTEMTPVDYRSLYRGSNGLNPTEDWPTRAQKQLARLEKQIPLSTTSATSLLDALMRFTPNTDNSSQIHCKHTVCDADGNNAAIGRILAHVQKQDAHDYLAIALPWSDNVPQDKRLLWQWILGQLAEANPGADQKTIAQQAIDLLLASTVMPNVTPVQDEAQNSNWRWDRKEAPSCPELPTPSLIRNSTRSEQLPDTTRILLAEWPVGSDPNSYQYENPYRETFEPVENVSRRPFPSSQPIKEVVRSSKKRPKVHNLPSQPISHRESPSSSQTSDHPSSSQNLDNVPAIAQTQTEPGRFGTRSSFQPAKRKKRTSGF